MVQIAKNIRNKAIVEDNSFRTKYHNRVCSTSAIAVSISQQQGLIISNPNQNASLIESIINGVIVYLSLPTCDSIRGNMDAKPFVLKVNTAE